MNKVVKIILAVAIVIAIPKIITKIMIKGGSTEKLEAIVKETQSKLPMSIDANTRLDKVEFANSTYSINYALIAQQVEFSEADKTRIEKYAVTQVCGGNLKIFSDEKITVEFIYSYTTEIGVQTMSIVIPPNKCAQ